MLSISYIAYTSKTIKEKKKAATSPINWVLKLHVPQQVPPIEYLNFMYHNVQNMP
jgi:hypothetical protein